MSCRNYCSELVHQFYLFQLSSSPVFPFFYIFLFLFFQDSANVVFLIVHLEDQAYNTYCEYAHQKGFSVRKAHVVYWTHTRIIKAREYKCSKAGHKQSKPTAESQVKFHRLDTKTGCLACINFSVDKEEKNWTVTKFVEEHNHPLAVKNEFHLLRSQRKISKVQDGLLKNMTDNDIRTVHAYNFLADEVGGFENVGFCKRDAYNFVQWEKQALIESGD
ncbi:hypothetical protein KSP39_PZI020074 [Platanthera zijinensis]|uniref:FAR1 domain-containing protein n=1 Tax=Platanthera zijinensis TaxID=2320716 RepID=A0AAP0AZI3_9ASPA